jgi:RHS repeat-associated protein
VPGDLAQPTKVEINGPLPAQSDGSDDITHIAYNSEGLIQSITNPLGQTTRITAYNRHGQPTEADLPNGIQVSLTYDPYHHIDTLTRRGGDLTETLDLDIDRNGLLHKLTLPDGSWQQFDYNAARQLTGLTNQLGEHLSIAPSPVNGAWTEQVVYNQQDRVERQYQRQLNSLGQVIKFLGQQGQQTKLDYMPGGQLTKVQEQGNTRPSQYHYDALNRLTHTLDALQGRTDVDYGLQGQIEQVTDAGGSRTDYRYNGFGEVIWQRSDASGEVIVYRDQAGRVVRQHGGNNAVASTDKASNEITDAQTTLGRDVNTGSQTTTNSSAGTSPDTPMAVRYRYDLLGRLTLADYPGTTDDIHYSYDQGENPGSLSQLTTLKDSSGSQTYTHDALGRVITDTRTGLDGKSNTITYRYNPKGQLAALVYPNGAEIRYHYRKGQLESLAYQDANGKHHKIVDEIAYHAFGGPKGWRYGNGLEYQREIDLDGRVSAIALTSSSPTTGQAIWSQTYRYNQKNDLTGIERHQRQAVSAQHANDLSDIGFSTLLNYGYDDLHRLVQESERKQTERDQTEQNHTGDSADEPEISTTYHYDPVGNRTLKVEAAPKTAKPQNELTYHYEPGNRLTGYNGLKQERDKQGNLTRQTTESKEEHWLYNAQNRPLAYTVNKRLKASYRHNALGQRTDKLLPDAHHHYRYNLSGQLIEEQRSVAGAEDNNKHTSTIHYLWLGDIPVAQITVKEKQTGQSSHAEGEITEIAYLHPDHLNTSRLATNENQTPVWKWQSDAFGVGEAEDDPDQDGHLTTVNLRFPGQYFDEESGLNYNYFRYYQAETGRYTQSDPIGLNGGWNTFAYVGGRPLQFSDFFGLETDPDYRVSRPWLFGTAVHSLFTEVMGASVGGMRFDTGGGIFGTGPGGGLLRPDAWMTDSLTGEGFIWELKPSTWQSGANYLAAQSQVGNYVVNATVNTGQLWMTGACSVVTGANGVRLPIGTIPFDGKVYEITIFGDQANPNSGLIFYDFVEIGEAEPDAVPVPYNLADQTESVDENSVLDWEYWEEITGLSGGALVLYLIFSEGSRLFPPRNAVPIP